MLSGPLFAGDACARIFAFRFRPSLASLARWLPCLLALAPLAYRVPYYVDWRTNGWLAQYFTGYLAHHGTLPWLVNTNEAIGMPHPLYYGYLFYPTAALFGQLLTGDGALRVLMAGVAVVCFGSVARAFSAVSGRWWLGTAVATANLWSAYGLTNLYFRNALLEYASVSCLTSGLLLFLSAIRGSHGRRGALLNQSAILLCFAAGAHPPTLVLGGVFLLAASPLVAVAIGRHWRRLPSALPYLGLAVAVLLPFVLVVLGSAQDLKIAVPHLGFSTDSIDRPSTRLWPLPIDPRVNRLGVANISTPYLTASLDYAMVLLWGAAAVYGWRAAPAGRPRQVIAFCAAYSALLAAAIAVVSVAPALEFILPSAVREVQFAYRLTSYIHLAFLLGAFTMWCVAGRTRGPAGTEPILRGAAICAVIFAAAVLFVKDAQLVSLIRDVTHAENWYGASYARNSASADFIMHTATDYSTPRRYPALPAGQSVLPVEAKLTLPHGAFGEIGSASVSCPRACFARLNAIASSWIVVTVNGVPARAADLYQDGGYFLIRLPAGTWRVGIEPAKSAIPDLRDGAFALWFLWLALTAFSAMRERLGLASTLTLRGSVPRTGSP